MGGKTPLEINVLKGARHIYINKYETRIIFSAANEGNDLDLYETLKFRTTGEWTIPLPISADLNTRYREDYPFLTDDRNRLYFSSDRPGGLGKSDIYCSEFNEATNRWGPAINLGMPINSIDNDLDFKLISDAQGIFCSDRMDSRGDLDIFLFTKN